MTGQKVNYRRLRNFLINPPFQFKFLSSFIGLFLLTGLSLYSTNFLIFWRLKEKALKIGIPKGHAFFMFIENQKSDSDQIFITLALFNFLLLIGTGLVVSHRIAGPLYRLKNFLINCDADSEDFKLRDKDFLRDFEPVANDLKDKIK